MTLWPLTIAYVPGLMLVCAVALCAALVTIRLPLFAKRVRVAAGGGLLAILAVDLIPDTLADAREEGVAWWLLVMLGLSSFGLFGVWRGHHGRHGKDHAGTAIPAVSSLHGLVEGLTIGVGAGINVVVGMPALLGMVIHKSVEGVDLALCLRAPESAGRTGLALESLARHRVGWLTLNAAAPLAGLAAAQALALPEIPVAVGMSLLCGILLQCAFRLCGDELKTCDRPGPWLGFVAAFVLTFGLATWANHLAG